MNDLEKAAQQYAISKIKDERNSLEGTHIAFRISQAFKAGAEWQKQQGWIDVNEKMPEPGQKCYIAILYDNGKYFQSTATWIPAKHITTDDFNYEGDDAEYDEDKDEYWTPQGWYENQYEPDTSWRLPEEKVTHWMPLPPAPNKPYKPLV